MAIEINAGDTFSVSCPNQDTPILKTGEFLPNEKDILVKVLKINKDSVTFGPFKTGEISFSLPCSSANIPVKAYVKELSPQVANQHYSPLNPETIDYPLSFFIFCGLLVLSVAGSVLYFINKRKNKIKVPEKKKTKLDPRSELEKHLLHCETSVKIPDNNHLHKTYRLLRNFLEKENNLNIRSLTTGEFIGTFRAMGLKQSKNNSLLSQLEYVLKTSDDMRFAKKTMSPQMWQDYLAKAKAIFLAFPKKNISEPQKDEKSK